MSEINDEAADLANLFLHRLAVANAGSEEEPGGRRSVKAAITYAFRRWVIAAVTLGLAGVVGGVLAHGPRHNPTRNDHVMTKGIPAKYKGIVNPLRLTADDLAAGRKLYNQSCAICHGRNGDGRGAAAQGLKPPPARLNDMYQRPMVGAGRMGPGAHLMHGRMHHHPGMTHAEAMGGLNLDAYNYWAITEGGLSMGSSMPAFGQTLTDKERWQILLYVANGFETRIGQ